MADQVKKTATKLALKHYFEQIWGIKHYSIPALLFVGVGATFTQYAPPLVVAAVIQRFGTDLPNLGELMPYILLFSGLWFAGEMLWRVSFHFTQLFEVRAMQNLYINALRELAKKDISFFHDNFAGSLTKRTLNYGRSFEHFFDTILFSVFANVFPLIFASVILWRYSPWLVVILIGSLSLMVVAITPLIKRRKKLVEIREAAANHMAGHVADVIGNMDAVQAFAHNDYEQIRHEANVQDYMKKAERSWHYHNINIDLKISPVYVLINALGLAIAVGVGDSGATIAAIFVTFSYYTQATRILWEFNRTYRNLENALTEAAQFTELLLKPPAIQDPEHPIPFKVTRGAIEFKNIHFAYENNQGTPLFADLNLSIRPGEKIALVGHSGGGKTTITKLLLRFMDVTDGELLIDGQNVAHARLADVRRAIAYVPQEPSMFHRTIRENIRYGRLDATDEEVIEAAKKAHAHKFIEKLPQGYETLVGERGVKLSGGQRQRIAIARAIIKNAPILVLDEATSALDSESEKHIQAALWELMKGRTAVVIAHRLSTIQKMDRIIVLENGKIIEQGTHTELLKKNGTYAKLWAHQSGGFLEE